MSTIYTVNNKVLKNSANDKWLTKYVDPYNPLGLPPGVMRFEAEAGWSPSGYDTSSLAFTQVSETPNVWDLQVLNGRGISNGATGSMTKILGFNATGLTDYSSGLMYRINYSRTVLTEVGPMRLPGYDYRRLFAECSALTKVGSLYTPDLTSASEMFYNCTLLRAIPFFISANVTDFTRAFYSTAITELPESLDTSSAITIESMCAYCANLRLLRSIATSNITSASLAFANCTNVESGALVLYQQMSTQANPPSTHENTFVNCGSNTVTGAAELAQIPYSWGGTGA